jgi:glycosyltransferase involved in cell wall biosynthesis
MSERNVLLVTARAPWPTSSGGQQRTFLLYQAIKRVANAHTLLVDPQPFPHEEEIAVMRQRFSLVHPEIHSTRRPSRWRRILSPGRCDLGYSQDLSTVISQKAQQLRCDTIVFRYLPLAGQAASPTGDGIRRVVDIDDAPSLRTRTEAEQEQGARRLAKRWVAFSTGLWQPKAIAGTDGGWVSCREDLDIIRDDRFQVLPNIPLDSFDQSVDESACEQVDSMSILFVGAMGYKINCQAVDWFLKNVWPKVFSKNHLAEFHIVGGGLDATRTAEYSTIPGVKMLGFVDDLKTAYRSCALSVVPISAGAGTKIKVLESLRFGRPVVLTTHSFRGYGHALRSGRDVIVEDDPGAMADSILDLLAAPGEREKMARSGQAIVAEHFGFDRFAAAVSRVLE